MEQRVAGRSGLVVSRLGLGTMTWGRDTDRDEAAACLMAYVEAGGNFVDTADVYVDGESEKVVGRLLRTAVRRDQIVLGTKAVGRTGPGPMGRGASRGHLAAALDASLKRLGTDYVDLWQLHAWDPIVPLEETLGALETAVSSGRARYVGVSNYAGWQLARAATLQQTARSVAPIVTSQVEYSLVERGIEREVVPAARALGVGLLAWSPLGRGVLTGKYRHGTPSDSRAASPHLGEFVKRYLNTSSASVVEAVATAADGLGVSPLAVALTWVRDRPGVASAILGARTAGQLQASLSLEDLELPEEIQSVLDEVSAPAVGYPERRR
ncbi:aldo/keto reductase [Epidermidibacterium keratini]|uniref:Aldo/keto reductase n=1 Tax=Epidermidibacterium keratini TaxID=1891644 RepID=A0A7L4YS41_9ACTN|nr:aldo/keto reductase [Epidermidibacterium keratini]QHC02071.1 aldo/keto reductase [Epidermidibacterium keratini]